MVFSCITEKCIFYRLIQELCSYIDENFAYASNKIPSDKSVYTPFVRGLVMFRDTCQICLLQLQV